MSDIHKDLIIYCGTIVKFRNGLFGIPIENTSRYGYDGEDVFILYDKLTNNFCGSININCYNDLLKCNMSVSSIIKVLESDINLFKDESNLRSEEWDVIEMKTYACSIGQLFQMLKQDEIF